MALGNHSGRPHRKGFEMHKDIVLNEAQRALVEHHLSVVDFVLMDHITVNGQITGLGRDDLYQEGCVWLCRAAATYDGCSASFGTYARKVVRNGLLSYCRKISRQPVALPLASDLPSDDDTTGCGHEPYVEDTADGVIDATDAMTLLRRMRGEYSGTARLGIEALELKVRGLDGPQIAAMYGVQTNHVSAWIAKAAQKLRSNPQVLSVLGKSAR